MLEQITCPVCKGSGIQMMQTSSMFGLVKREVPTSCDNCFGIGHLTELPHCQVCSGRGLLGNESEVCRSCNGTGKVDTFALIPQGLLTQGTIFERRCDQCNNDRFELVSGIEQYRFTKSWDDIEELRQVEIIDRVRVSCTMCSNSYHIPVDNAYHKELTAEMASELERLGVNVGFLYQARPGALSSGPPATQPTAPQA